VPEEVQVKSLSIVLNTVLEEARIEEEAMTLYGEPLTGENYSRIKRVLGLLQEEHGVSERIILECMIMWRGEIPSSPSRLGTWPHQEELLSPPFVSFDSQASMYATMMSGDYDQLSQVKKEALIQQVLEEAMRRHGEHLTKKSSYRSLLATLRETHGIPELEILKCVLPISPWVG
jgi:hypothetical protein